MKKAFVHALLFPILMGCLAAMDQRRGMGATARGMSSHVMPDGVPQPAAQHTSGFSTRESDEDKTDFLKPCSGGWCSCLCALCELIGAKRCAAECQSRECRECCSCFCAKCLCECIGFCGDSICTGFSGCICKQQRTCTACSRTCNKECCNKCLICCWGRTEKERAAQKK